VTSYTAVKVIKKETYPVKNSPEQVYVTTIEHIICLSKVGGNYMSKVIKFYNYVSKKDTAYRLTK